MQQLRARLRIIEMAKEYQEEIEKNLETIEHKLPNKDYLPIYPNTIQTLLRTLLNKSSVGAKDIVNFITVGKKRDPQQSTQDIYIVVGFHQHHKEMNLINQRINKLILIIKSIQEYYECYLNKIISTLLK
ncbi:unnamed protein product, partial [Didymodactylos carnosus]